MMGVADRKVLFLANDPGGYDVIRPIYDTMSKQTDIRCDLSLSGPSGIAHSEFQVEPDDYLDMLMSLDLSQKKYALVTGTSWNSNVETDAIRLCRSKNIVTISVLDFWSNYRMRFVNGGTFVFPDYFFVMDNLAAREAIETGVDSIIRPIGHPGLDFLYGMREGHLASRPDTTRRVLLLSQPIKTVYGDSLGFDEYEVTDDIVRACSELGYELSILFHPKDDNALMKQYADHVISGKIHEIVSGFNVVVSMITIGLLHCSFLGVPVISYQPHPTESDMCVTDRLGITRRLTTYDELIGELSADLNYNRDIVLPEWFDGKSAERGMREINKAIEEFYQM